MRKCVSACRDIVSFIVCLPVAMASADLHFIRNILDGEMMGGACGTYGVQRNAYRFRVKKPEAKRRLGRRSLIWEDSIKMDLK